MKVTSIEKITNKIYETLSESYIDTIEKFDTINCDKHSREKITHLNNCVVCMGFCKPLIIEVNDTEIDFFRYEEDTKEYKWLGWLEYANFKNFVCFMIAVVKRITCYEPNLC